MGYEMICALTPSFWTLKALNTTYVNTCTLQVFGVDTLPLLIKTIKYKREDCPPQAEIFMLHDRNYPAQIHTYSHWVTDIPINLHPITLDNHFEIHFQWHIHSPLPDNPWSKLTTKELLNLDYIHSTQNCFRSTLRDFWVQWLVAQVTCL